MTGKPLKILACGGRDFEDYAAVCWQLSHIEIQGLRADMTGPITLVHGDVRGADRLAAAYAKTMGWTVKAYPADWKMHGKAAGPIRNRRMLDEKPDVVVAFPGGPGTADMVKQARKAGIPVVEAGAPADQLALGLGK